MALSSKLTIACSNSVRSIFTIKSALHNSSILICFWDAFCRACFNGPAQDIGKPAIAAFEGVMFRVLFYFGKRQQIFNDCRKTVDLSGDDAEEPLGINAVFSWPRQEAFQQIP